MYEDTLFPQFCINELSQAILGYEAPLARPTAATRWIARSSLQKTIRRGSNNLAQRALATLLAQNPSTIWSHLTVIALEDVGVAGMDLVHQVTTASRNKRWRHAVGGDWKVASFLVAGMCASNHCQAACDLLLRSSYDPEFEQYRSDAMELPIAELAKLLCDRDLPLEHRGVAALAIGGGLAEGQTHRDANAVFGLLADCLGDASILRTCHDAWRTCRNEMAFLLPLVWEAWQARENEIVEDDWMPPATVLGGVPDYALDQHTREGGQVARRYLARTPNMQALLDLAGVPATLQPKTVGNLLFLLDGSCLRQRAVWPVADRLRLPFRTLPLSAQLGSRLPEAMRFLADQCSVIAFLRGRHLHPT